VGNLFNDRFAWLARQFGHQRFAALEALQPPEGVREYLPSTPIDEQDWIRQLKTVPL
jgi:hypothetical protein